MFFDILSGLKEYFLLRLSQNFHYNVMQGKNRRSGNTVFADITAQLLIFLIHHALADPGQGIEIFRCNYFHRNFNFIAALKIINELEQPD